MNKKTDIATGRKIQENKEIKAAEKADEESAKMHSRRITASWLMEIIRHLYIAAYSLDGDTVANIEKYWRTEDMGVITSDWERDAEINLSDAYHHLLFGNPHMEQFLESVVIVPEPKHLFDNYDVIKTYLPDIAMDAIMDFRHRRDERTDSDMSFTGLMLLNDGILAFGDTKGTRKLADGTLKQEEGRIVQKVFQYENKLLTTHGLNEISFGHGIIRMEDYINDCTRRKVPLHDMIANLSESTILTQIEEENRSKNAKDRIPAQYCFITSDGCNRIESIVVASDSIDQSTIIKKDTNNNDIQYIISRNPDYDDAFKAFVDELNCCGCRKIDDVKPRLQEWLETRIREMDKKLEYNSVGLPLQIEFLKI